jgi:hypothetical protein
MSIQNFYGSAVTNDFARLFQFRILDFQLNNNTVDFGYVAGNVGGAGETIYVETANLPGRSINNVQVPFMGLSFNVPGTTSFPGSNNYPVTFRCDQAYAIRSGLENALRDTFHIGNTAGRYSTPGENNYIVMQLFGKKQGDGIGPTPIRTYKLVGVYLINLADTLYDVKDTGSVAMINATLGYQYWTAEFNNSGNVAPDGWTQTKTFLGNNKSTTVVNP